MARRIFLALAVWLVCSMAAPSASAAARPNLVREAQREAKQRVFLLEARKQLKATRTTLKLTAAQTAAGKKLTAKLSPKQRAALRQLVNVTLQDVRAAAAAKKKSFAVSAKRLRPHVVAIGSKDANALLAASLEGAADGMVADVAPVAAQLQKNLDQKKQIREDMSELRDIIAEGKYPVAFTYSYPRETTVQLASKAQANNLLEDLEAQYQTLADMSQQLQLQLQDAMNKQQQAMQILSNIMKNQHDTLKAIIQNMK